MLIGNLAWALRLMVSAQASSQPMQSTFGHRPPLTEPRCLSRFRLIGAMLAPSLEATRTWGGKTTIVGGK